MGKEKMGDYFVAILAATVLGAVLGFVTACAGIYWDLYVMYKG